MPWCCVPWQRVMEGWDGQMVRAKPRASRGIGTFLLPAHCLYLTALHCRGPDPPEVCGTPLAVPAVMLPQPWAIRPCLLAKGAWKSLPPSSRLGMPVGSSPWAACAP